MLQAPAPSQSVSDRPRPVRPRASGLGVAWILLLLGAQAPGPAPDEAPAPPPRKPAPIYALPPKTPIEFWDAADYLLRTGQPRDAAPYLNQFMQSNPDDATLMKIRDKYGFGSIMRLQDYPETRALAAPLAKKLSDATRRHATNPERIARFVEDLTATQAEQDYAVERLREAGALAVPALLQRLDKPGLSPEARALLVRNGGRLDSSAIPALIAVLDGVGEKPLVASDVAEMLGRIGDRRAIPSLTALAVSDDAGAPAGEAARRAIGRITNVPFEAQAKSAVRLLTDEARRYHVHAINFPGDPVTVWIWDADAQAPAPRTMSRSDAESYFGTKLARAALKADSGDREAQAVLISLALEQAIGRAGFANFPAQDPSGTFAAAVAAGPAVLGGALRQAIADGKNGLAAVVALALGKVTDANALGVDGGVNPLVEALSAPGRRARFAAAKALVELDPRRAFAGSSRVVPTLAQFVATGSQPRALVIDGNLNRGSQLAGFLKELGYEPTLEPTGAAGFQTAARSADYELIILDNHMIQGNWRLHDTLANLRADARTAGIPLYVVGPLKREIDLNALMTERFPGVKFLVTPTDAATLKAQLNKQSEPKPEEFTVAERESCAKEAAALLAQIASRPNNPFERDLARIEPELTRALSNPATSEAATAALGEVPEPNAQRGLADVLIDPSRPGPLRLSAANRLARSVQRFGPLVASEQEKGLAAAFDRETDTALKAAIGAVIGALRPKAAASGERLRQLETAPGATRAPDPASLSTNETGPRSETPNEPESNPARPSLSPESAPDSPDAPDTDGRTR